MNLVLMRHGSTLWNEQKRYLGHTDLSLSPRGREELTSAQAKLIGMNFDRVYCSDLARCRESLNAVRPDLAAGAIYDRALREMDFGAWEGHTYDQLKDTALYRQWLDDPQQVTPPEGEAWASFEGRIAAFLGRMLPSSEVTQPEPPSFSTNVLAVAHGGVIRQIATQLVSGLAFWEIEAGPGQLLGLTLEQREESWTGAELRIL
ncbi:histidine phosphatase family protein [Paenibacillus chibensis]|nr:histidine phosphatase family protein [Paenibacillus chibensis]MEC0373654.1 histidine phosphatase family protein [Paenibacillus chibensis]